MIKNAKLDAISNVTPDRFHLNTSLEILQSKIHLLCEKPLAENYPDAFRMTQAAKKSGVINMVHFTYRKSAALDTAAQLIHAGKIGSLRHISGEYLQSWLVANTYGDWKTSPSLLWRLSTAHGSKGVLGDVGVHLIDFVTRAAGSISSVNCHLKTFKKTKTGRIGKYQLDANDSAIITAEFKNGASGVLSCTRFATGHANTVRASFYGDQGSILLNLDDSYENLKICRGKNIERFQWDVMKSKEKPSVIHLFIQSIRSGKVISPTFNEASELQKVLDACFVSSKKSIKVLT